MTSKQLTFFGAVAKEEPYFKQKVNTHCERCIEAFFLLQ